ncbi:putative short chain dehydrogenase/reductase [Aspergillus saccharolyticus JOP 1030-1]|uniref:Putative short chain dehydrogenase/reductase n=1 Tax=Aspergillus saccharolyticus JOP 1030-1 TaxID=1450539 RepID=A0A318ZRQ5_9EURO|nr:putative short chain dehydrogenase/reductase [Aspergillus saccharolyticus JOP 1030-1]PYH49284.1 putative short chain dehydrogenase/reductase [Aspergillus saccharolyticus JOP 1030-1]
MLNLDYTISNLKGKTILITGGASGFGAAFAARWASAGAQIIIGDINPAGETIVAQIRTESANENVHFIHLDVTSWSSQVNFFRQAVQLSQHGGIDAVVANAGINDRDEARQLENPTVDYLNDPHPPAPSSKTVDVNLSGVLYTVHLAQWFLPRNPDSQPCSESEQTSHRDRHILLVGSTASLHPLISQAPYTITKHAVLGLFRCLRVTAPVSGGIRVNIICPYFTDIGLMNAPARVILAGVPIGQPEDVVEAATYLMANQTCSGRSLVTGPRLKLGLPDRALLSRESLDEQTGEGEDSERGVWECQLHDVETADIFTERMLKAVKAVVATRGWIGWAKGLAGALAWPVMKNWNKA